MQCHIRWSLMMFGIGKPLHYNRYAFKTQEDVGKKMVLPLEVTVQRTAYVGILSHFLKMILSGYHICKSQGFKLTVHECYMTSLTVHWIV